MAFSSNIQNGINPHMRNRIVLIFSGIGFLIPIILFLGVLVELSIDVKKIPFSRTLYNYLWPSSVLLGATANPDSTFLFKSFIFLMALFSNVLLYAMCGVIVGFIWSLAFKGQKSN